MGTPAILEKSVMGTPGILEMDHDGDPQPSQRTTPPVTAVPPLSHPTQAEHHHLLPVGLSSSPALTTDPAGDAAIPYPAFVTSPLPFPLAATSAGAAGLWQGGGCSGSSAGSGALALLSSRQLSGGRCVSSRLFVTLLIFSVCAGCVCWAGGGLWGGSISHAMKN